MADAGRSRWPLFGAAVLIAAASVLIFARLGHYPLWDDEATTAMFGRNLLRTGDTSALVGHNLIAYRGGRELENLKMRYLPPLQSVAVAGGALFFGESNFGARVVFAAAGVLTFVVIAIWLMRADAGALIWIGMGIALLCNVSLLLFTRQCRYYGLTIFFSVWMAYLWCHRDGTKWNQIAFILSSLALLASNYLCFAALCVAILSDLLTFGRKAPRWTAGQWAWTLGTVALLGGLIVWVFNPLGKGIVHEEDVSFVLKRVKLLWWNVRDLNACEFGVGILLAIAPVVALVYRDRALGRAWTAAAVYVLSISVLSPQPITVTHVADVRYLIALIPLFAFIGVRVIVLACRGRGWAAIPIMLLCFGGNLAHGTWIERVALASGARPIGVRCTIAEYIGELIEPQRSAFGETADWINEHVSERANVWVLPGHMLYPLMLYAPHPLYGYQLVAPVEEQFKDLPDLDVHVIGQVPPDYVVCFGPQALNTFRNNEPDLASMGARYDRAASIEVGWMATTRPELFWHEFRTVTEFNRDFEGVYVFRRKGAPRVTSPDRRDPG